LIPPGKAGVPVVALVGALVAGHLHLVGVDDDDVVAHVHMGGEGRLVLAAQAHGDQRREPAQNDALGVDQDPFLVDVARFGAEGLHDAFRGSTGRGRTGSSQRRDAALIPDCACRVNGRRSEIALSIQWLQNTVS
jgi:hypothetical protein